MKMVLMNSSCYSQTALPDSKMEDAYIEKSMITSGRCASCVSVISDTLHKM